MANHKITVHTEDGIWLLGAVDDYPFEAKVCDEASGFGIDCGRVEPEIFDQVQKILAKNKKRRSKVLSRHPFAGKIVCGDCGGFYGHKVWRLRSTGERYDVWYCNHKYDNDKNCDTPRLRETEIREAFEKMLQECGDPNPIYTNERWNELVESVKIYKGNHLIFTLESGKIVKITL